MPGLGCIKRSELLILISPRISHSYRRPPHTFMTHWQALFSPRFMRMQSGHSWNDVLHWPQWAILSNDRGFPGKELTGFFVLGKNQWLTHWQQKTPTCSNFVIALHIALTVAQGTGRREEEAHMGTVSVTIRLSFYSYVSSFIVSVSGCCPRGDYCKPHRTVSTNVDR